MLWGVPCLVIVAALTWSGPFYLPYRLFLPAVASAGILGAVAGWALTSCPARKSSRSQSALATLPAFLPVVWLVGAAHSHDDRINPNYVADLGTYRGGCLAGSAYGDHAVQTVSVSRSVVTVHPHTGSDLHFTRTGHSWPTPERAELGGEGVRPADDLTLTILAAHGCS
jgi:hypothetical protein